MMASKSRPRTDGYHVVREGKSLAMATDCHSCPAQYHYIMTPGSKPKPGEFMSKIMQRDGWQYHRRGKHLCPVCIEEKRRAGKGETMPTTKPEAPREPTHLERRKIFRAVDDAYADDGGYCGGATDETIARDLNVPRAWVSKIREENFGADQSNADMVALKAELEAELEAIIQNRDAALEVAAKLDDRAAEVKALRKRLDAIVGAAKGLEGAKP